MNRKFLLMLALVAVVCGLVLTVQSQMGGKHEVNPMYGSLLIDGYDFKNDVGPKGTIIYDEDKMNLEAPTLD